jgi:integrase/recombinase XerD
MMRDALRDRSYRATPLGLEVSRYYRWKKNEWGATAETLRDYEAILAKLALDHADLKLPNFEPPLGTERLRDFIDNRWGDKAGRTRAKVISVLRDFFAYQVREQRLHGNPALPISRPRRRDSTRGTFNGEDVAKLLASCTRQRDRVAVLLLFRLGLRKGELARLQFRHYDGRNLTVQGSSATSSIDGQHRTSSSSTRRRSAPSSTAGQWASFGKNRLSELSPTAIHRWWTKRLQDAELPHRPMHEARHTAITQFLRDTGNLKLAQMLAGHADISTTANIYAHLDTSDLETALRTRNRR